MIKKDILKDLDRETLIELVMKLSTRIDELELRLDKNSSNSSKPPSSDGYKKPSPKSLRGKTGKRSGGQHGHKGSTLKQVTVPDFIIRHQVANCQKCGFDLEKIASSEGEKRQVFDIPQPKIEVTEHVTECKTCPHCAHMSKAIFPESILAPAQYGPRIYATAIYMLYQQFIPEERLAQTFADTYGVNICSATLGNSWRKIYDNLASHEQNIEIFLQNSKLVHFDETGLRVNTTLEWLHSASNSKATLYKVHAKRGFDAMSSFNVHSNFTGIAVHDHWKSYFKMQTQNHALCNAHILRELVGIYERDGPKWASKMEQFLYKAHRYVGAYQEERKLPDEYLAILLKEYDEILLSASRYYNDTEKPSQISGNSLFVRLRDYKTEILRFMSDFDVPFSNNQAEQDVRMCKVRQKISGCFRSNNGSLVFCRIRGYLSTVRKQGLNVFGSITNAINGQPFLIQF